MLWETIGIQYKSHYESISHCWVNFYSICWYSETFYNLLIYFVLYVFILRRYFTSEEMRGEISFILQISSSKKIKLSVSWYCVIGFHFGIYVTSYYMVDLVNYKGWKSGDMYWHSKNVKWSVIWYDIIL